MKPYKFTARLERHVKYKRPPPLTIFIKALNDRDAARKASGIFIGKIQPNIPKKARKPPKKNVKAMNQLFFQRPARR